MATVQPVSVEVNRTTRSGPKTTEFWVTILCTLAGLYLIVFKDDVTNGTILIGVGSAGYAVSRGLAKRGETE